MNRQEEIRLQERAAKLRLSLLEHYFAPHQMAHLGGASSCVEILAALYFHAMRYDPKRPLWEERDYFVLSKGHAAIALYTALALAGVFPEEELATCKDLGSGLQGHPVMGKAPGIEANTGSLGQGLSLALGMALGLGFQGKKNRVYALLGDGEIQEGQVWEALMAAGKFRLPTLTAIVDMNGFQAMGPVQERMPLGHLKPALESFGWRVLEVDGHDVTAVANMLDAPHSGPKIILARTVKGYAFPCAGRTESHNTQLTAQEYDVVHKELTTCWKEALSHVE